ncbi:carbohydrate ABC transporter permease [Blautia sp.]|jgi:multiple sugar transport system permease protein|uniref:carbohydrate ABC transporter permease n=1 Tax=Blautia sp. TaxID=1955243 RepID=UPI003D949502
MIKNKNIWITGAKAVIGAVILVIALFPIYWLLLMAVRPAGQNMESISLIPKGITFEYFGQLFRDKGFDIALKNSLINSGISLLISLSLGLSTSYVLARKRFSFSIRKPMTGWILLIRVLPPVAFIIPLYIIFGKLGILETRIPIILACVLINLPLVIWFMLTFFKDVPEEVEESAKMDGASEWQIFYRIILPLVLPGIAAVAMLAFMYSWNEYTYSIILTRSPQNYTIPLALAVLNTEDNVTNFGLVSAGGITSFIPMALFVLFAQNYLISGLSSGAVKE